MLVADRSSWKNSPPPSERQGFEVAWNFSAEIGQRIMAGHVPEGMDDRWFILMEDGWLLFHRSWSGHCIFGLKVDDQPDRVSITEGWVSRKAVEYSSVDIQKDVELARTLLDGYFGIS